MVMSVDPVAEGSNASELVTALTRSAVRHLGEGVALLRCRPLSGGASASTWEFDAVHGAVTEPLILQLATGERFEGSLSKTQQGMTQRMAFENGIPTPQVRWILEAADGLGEGYVSTRIAGETLGKRIVHDAAFSEARAAMPAQCASILANIHRLRTDAFEYLPALDTRALIARLAAQHREYGEHLPVFEYAIRWLQRNIPKQRRVSLVHGDFRTGNLLVDANGIVAVLDWELAHLGDPMEDLGWLCMNAWRFGQIDLPVGGFGNRHELYSAYEQAAGVPVDAAAVRFWEVYGALKWGVICQYFAFQYIGREVRSIERASIGRRVCETELDLLDLIGG